MPAPAPAAPQQQQQQQQQQESQSPLHFLADLAEQKSREEKKGGRVVKPEPSELLDSLNGKCGGGGGGDGGSTLRDLLTSTAGKLRLGSTDAGIAFAPVYNNSQQMSKPVHSMPNILDDIIASVVENKIPASKMAAKLGLKQEVTQEDSNKGKQPIKTEEEEEMKVEPDMTPPPHDWLGAGEQRLLWLKEPAHHGNCSLFRECWTQEQPVLVSGLQRLLTPGLWRPESFTRESSGHHGDMLNCRDGSVASGRVKEFWEGFEDMSRRPKTADGESAVHRLKDWPTGEDLITAMPSRYDDVMKNLPVPQYCDPEGHLNLAGRLPPFFVRPDLGPRLSCAYGAFSTPEQSYGTVNLHAEVSDTISVLVYVGVAKGSGAPSKTAVLKRLEREDLEEGVRRRLRDPAETPGALWHVYRSKDLLKVQAFLRKVWREGGGKKRPGTGISRDDDDSDSDGEVEPLREGSVYLSPALRQRLQSEEDVTCRTILQFHGDALILPAGTMHQVLNLHGCVQVSTDFLSAEHAHNSYYLTQELRPSKDLMNFEDKLQVKNILYHSVKEAITTLKKSCGDADAKTSAPTQPEKEEKKEEKKEKDNTAEQVKEKGTEKDKKEKEQEKEKENS